MKIWFNKNFSSIAFLLQELQKNPQVTTLFSHIEEVEYQKYADEFIYEPENSDDYLNFCLAVCRQYNVDVFYPWRNFSTLYPHRAQFAELGVTVIFPCSATNFRLIDNKAAFYRHLLAHKIAVNIPLFATANNKAEFMAEYDLLRPRTEKVCMKPAVSIYAAGFKIIHDEAGYDPWQALLCGKDQYAIAYRHLVELLPEQFFNEIMLLDFLPGDEYSHDMLCRDGKIIAGTIRQKHNAADKYQTLIQNAELERMSRLLVAEFKLNGFINVQYRDDKNGVPFVLEINPRISGGIAKVAVSGIDYVNLFVKSIHHETSTMRDIQQEYGLKVGADKKYVVIR